MNEHQRQQQHGVIVVDDEYGARLQVELALMTSRACRLIGQANDGARGAELAERLQPAIVVLDLSMPVMDGFEAIPLLRSVSPGSTILVRSSNDDPAAAERALALGASDFIPKMLSPEELGARIEAALPPPSPARVLLEAARRHRRPRAVFARS